jgi:hypothetical protein
MKIIFWVSKISEFFLDVANDEVYKCAKSQCETLCVLGYTKMKKYMYRSIVNSAYFKAIRLVRFFHFYVA